MQGGLGEEKRKIQKRNQGIALRSEHSDKGKS